MKKYRATVDWEGNPSDGMTVIVSKKTKDRIFTVYDDVRKGIYWGPSFLKNIRPIPAKKRKKRKKVCCWKMCEWGYGVTCLGTTLEKKRGFKYCPYCSLPIKEIK